MDPMMPNSEHDVPVQAEMDASSPLESESANQGLISMLVAHSEWKECPLDDEHKMLIAVAVVKKSATITQALERFRRCVLHALHNPALSDVQKKETFQLHVGDYSFQLPKSVENVRGIVDLPRMKLILSILEDIAQILHIADIHRHHKRLTRQMLEEERANFTEVMIKDQGFKDICASWGFSIPISACSLSKQVPKISRQVDLSRKISLLSKVIDSFRSVIESSFEAERG